MDVFREIKPDGLVLMTGNPAEIAHRLKARDGKDWDASFLATFQEEEMNHAEKIADALHLPLYVLDGKANPYYVMGQIQKGWKQ